MEYFVEGESLPVLKIRLSAGESVCCEGGAMSWMDQGIKMQTQSGGLGKMLGRMITKESAFGNVYYAEAPGEIAFASKFPGSIKAVEVTPNMGIVVQKGSFLASVGNIDSRVFFQQSIGGGFFGGEGFLMREYTGSGIVFLEVDGSAHEYDLAPGESKIVDTGHVAAMSSGCSLRVETVKGVKNVLFGGEGLFNTVVTGPGKVVLQSMPVPRTAAELYRYMPHPTNH